MRWVLFIYLFIFTFFNYFYSPPPPPALLGQVWHHLTATPLDHLPPPPPLLPIMRIACMPRVTNPLRVSSSFCCSWCLLYLCLSLCVCVCCSDFSIFVRQQTTPSAHNSQPFSLVFSGFPSFFLFPFSLRVSPVRSENERESLAVIFFCA